MKKFAFAVIAATLLFAGCSETTPQTSSSVSNNAQKEESSQVTSQVVSEVKEDIRLREPNMTNLTYDNGNGKMSDTDGPAYVVYSKKGYNKASVEIKVSQLELNNVRKSDGKFVNAYMFLGTDIYNSGGYWVNCFDTGLCYSGKSGGWHVFYNLYSTESESTTRWYESKVILNRKHDYRLTLDSSKTDGRATLTVFDITANKIVDTVEFEAQYALADGSNTNYLQNYALDYPENVKNDTSGNYTKDDFAEVTLYNTDENLFMKNVIIENAKICKNGEEFSWTEEHSQNRAMWPDKKITKIDYDLVKVWTKELDNSYVIDFNMNRK